MLEGVAGVVLIALRWAILLATVAAFVNAAMQRQDAYTAADKLTKPVWLAILGGAGVLCLLFGVSVLVMTIAAVATGVYLADVRPKLLEVQGKSR